MITIDKISDDTFRATISKGITTTHQVHITQDYYDVLTDEQISRRKLVELSLSYLLEHESQGSIHPSFDLHQIGYYFPDFEEEIKLRVRDEVRDGEY